MNTERILLVDDSENDNLFHEITISKTGFAGEIRAFESAEELRLEGIGAQVDLHQRLRPWLAVG